MDIMSIITLVVVCYYSPYTLLQAVVPMLLDPVRVNRLISCDN